MEVRRDGHHTVNATEDIGGKMDEDYTYAPDITMDKLDTSVLYPDGCIYNRSAIECPEKKRYDGQCEKCGWNPRVSRHRAYLIRKQLYEEEANAAD